MGRTLTATFTFVSDIFVHFSLPPCLCAELSMCSLRIPDKKSGFLPEKKGPLVKQPQESRPRGEQICSFSFLYIHPDSLSMQAQRSAPAPDSIPTAIFHWEHDCYPLADWRRPCPRGGTDLRTAPLTGGRKPVAEKCDAV